MDFNLYISQTSAEKSPKNGGVRKANSDQILTTSSNVNAKSTNMRSIILYKHYEVFYVAEKKHIRTRFGLFYSFYFIFLFTILFMISWYVKCNHWFAVYFVFRSGEFKR